MRDVLLVVSFTVLVFPFLFLFDFVGLGAIVLLAAILLPIVFPNKPGPPAHGE